MNFLDFMFFPLIAATLIAVVIEQIMRRVDSLNASDGAIYIAMTIRKFLYRQAWIVNFLWFLGFFIFTFVLGRKTPPDMMGDPNLLWKL